MSIEDSIKSVKERIQKACERAKRKVEEVRIVAVSKGVEVERIIEAKRWGIRDFGENYVQEARKKIEILGNEDLTWHMIGYIQTNKVKYLPTLFQIIHSIDRWEVLELMERFQRPKEVLFQLNLSKEASKHGLDEDGLKRILEKVATLRYIKPLGLMTIAPYTEDQEKVRPLFKRLREILEDLNRQFSLQMRELSMGMSQDFEVAIEEGATMVRIGRAIFGERR